MSRPGGAALLPGAHGLEVAGEQVQLLAESAWWWPAGGLLCVADLHFGKGAVFRARGIPVPSGSTAESVARLEALLRLCRPASLAVLGDFFHAAESQTPPVLQALLAWRERWSALQCLLIRGNHDRHAGDPPPSLGITVVDETWRSGPFALCHHPQTVSGAHVLCGHVHPVCRLQGAGRDRLRLPCFVVDADQTMLPAFGSFTGGELMSASPARRIYPLGAGRVWPGLA